MSTRTALYRLFAVDDALLYIGISSRFGQRWMDHAKVKPWWPAVHHQTITWYDSRDEADEAETAAIAAEHPLHNIAKVPRPPEPPRPAKVARLREAPPPAPVKTFLTTTEVGALASTTRYTVEREIHRGKLEAKRLGRQWVVHVDEATRWVAQFRPYAGLRKHDPLTG